MFEAADTFNIRSLMRCLSGATHLQDKLLIDVALCNAGLKVGILQEAQEKLVYELQDRKREEIIPNEKNETLPRQLRGAAQSETKC